MVHLPKPILIVGTLGVFVTLAGCGAPMTSQAYGPSYFEEGMSVYEQDQYDETLAALEETLKVDPQNTEALFLKGVISQKQERIKDALLSYRQVVRMDPSHYKAHYNLGNIYSYDKANNPQAVFHYRRFLELAPAHPLARNTRTRLAELTGTSSERGLSLTKGNLEGETQDDVRLTGELMTLSEEKQQAATPLPTGRSRSLAPAVPPVKTDPPLPRPHAREVSFSPVVCIHGEGRSGRVEGSGFMVASGYVLGTGHQVEQSERLSVQFENGSIYPAVLLSVSSSLDLALLQIPPQGVSPLSFSPSKTGRIGEEVRAVGCPYGLNHTVSRGIVSGPERRLRQRPMLQTDVAINPGNSGGPLLNDKGEVLGVIVGMLPEAKGIAFAVPARESKRFLGETFFQIATLFAEVKRYSEAVEALNLSTGFWPQSAKAFSNLGEVYRRMNKIRSAEEAFLKAVEVDQKYADAHYNLGVLYDNHIKRPQKAALHFRKYLHLKPSSPDARQVGRWLTALEGRGGE